MRRFDIILMVYWCTLAATSSQCAYLGSRGTLFRAPLEGSSKESYSSNEGRTTGSSDAENLALGHRSQHKSLQPKKVVIIIEKDDDKNYPTANLESIDMILDSDSRENDYDTTDGEERLGHDILQERQEGSAADSDNANGEATLGSDIQKDQQEETSPEPKKVTVDAKLVITHDYQTAYQAQYVNSHTNFMDYVQVMIGLVNDILKSFDSKVLDVQIAVSGVVPLTKKQSLFIKTFNEEKTTIDRSKMDVFETFLKRSTNFESTHIVLFLTSFKIGTRGVDGINSDIKGVANVGGACNSKYAVVREDPGTLEAVLNIVHEIGHLLGSMHDGDEAPKYLKNSPGARNCSSSDGYIMASHMGSTGKREFSECTLKQIIAFTENSRGQCLSDATPRHNVDVTEKIEDALPNRDTYCQLLHPNIAGITMVEEYPPYSIQNCTLICSEQKKDGTSYMYIRDAPHFTPCGLAEDDKKVCIAGKCNDLPASLKSFSKSVKEQLKNC